MAKLAATEQCGMQDTNAGPAHGVHCESEADGPAQAQRLSKEFIPGVHDTDDSDSPTIPRGA